MRVVLALDTLVEVLRFTVSLGCQRNTGVEVLLLELERLQAKSCLLFANVAGGLAELVLATLVAKLKIKTENVLLVVVEVDLIFDVFSTEEILGSTRATLEAIGTLPVTLWNHDQLRL